jgi:hypothetical protein
MKRRKLFEHFQIKRLRYRVQTGIRLAVTLEPLLLNRIPI